MVYNSCCNYYTAVSATSIRNIATTVITANDKITPPNTNITTTTTMTETTSITTLNISTNATTAATTRTATRDST